MPAADLTRLRMQINQLILIFDKPEDFLRRLHDLFILYGNHAYRAGQAVKPQTLLPSYRIPPLVMRQLEVELGKTCQERPQLALPVLDILWKDSYLEPRLLAASLLGVLPIQEVSEQVLQKLREWCRPEENLRVFMALMELGTVRLRREAPELLLSLIETWITSADLAEQGMGVRALAPLIDDPSFENLPAAYRMLGPLTQNVAVAVQADLQATLQALIRRSPVETAYFLRQVLSMSAGQSTARLVRRLLAEFPPAQQARLKAALQTL